MKTYALPKTEEDEVLIRNSPVRPHNGMPALAFRLSLSRDLRPVLESGLGTHTASLGRNQTLPLAPAVCLRRPSVFSAYTTEKVQQKLFFNYIFLQMVGVLKR